MSENKLKERSPKLIANTVNYKLYLVKNVQQRGLDHLRRRMCGPPVNRTASAAPRPQSKAEIKRQIWQGDNNRCVFLDPAQQVPELLGRLGIHLIAIIDLMAAIAHNQAAINPDVAHIPAGARVNQG